MSGVYYCVRVSDVVCCGAAWRASHGELQRPPKHDAHPREFGYGELCGIGYDQAGAKLTPSSLHLICPTLVDYK